MCFLCQVLKELNGGVSEQNRPDEWSTGDPLSLFEVSPVLWRPWTTHTETHESYLQDPT